MLQKSLGYDPRKDSIKLLFQNKGTNFSTIDFNYPSLNRKDLNNLSLINDKSHPFKKLSTNRNWSLNLYNLDISGSCPHKFISNYINKIDFVNKNDDIEKSSPKKYYPYINKISFNLNNDDIELSKPKQDKNKSNRHTNPLSPKYPELKYIKLPMPSPKFIRDSIDIKDIKGSSPNKLGFNKNLFKEPIKKEEILGSSAKKPYLRKTKYEYMDYRDITKKKIVCRNTNPLKPIYNWRYTEDKKLLGPIDGNYPLVLSKYLYRNPFNLNNKDIEGSNTGSKYPILKYKGNTFYLKTKDIEGAQGDTLIRGIITKRHTNPINPKYQYLDHSEIQDKNNNRYFKEFKDNKTKDDDIINNDDNNNNNKKILTKIKIAKKVNEDKNNNILNVNKSMNEKIKNINQINQNKENNTFDFNADNKNRKIHNCRKMAKIKNQKLYGNMSNSLSVSSAATLDIFGLKNYKFINNKNEKQSEINKKDNYTSLKN